MNIVILSEAKDHLAMPDHRKKILRFAQDDKSFRYTRPGRFIRRRTQNE